MASADQASSLVFDMPSSVTVNKKGAELIIIRSTSSENSCITVMLEVTADGRKCRPYFILKRKMSVEEQLPSEVFYRA